ncbi:MAG: hypothetical protein AAGD25_25530 [Cyanobacteria bacterium P01_F01_bin.150]
MKFIFNICTAVAMLCIVHWTIENIVLSPDTSPIGGNTKTDIEPYRGEIDTFREAK